MKTTVMKGSLAVGRNIYAGGSAVVHGSAHIRRDLRVEGWLDAPNVKRDSKGLFLTPEALAEAYPWPEPGWWALVGTTLPADLYVESEGLWTATGGTGGELTADTPSLTALAETFAAQTARAEEVLAQLEDVAARPVEISGQAEWEAMNAAGGVRPGQLYCSVDPDTRRVTSIYLG